LLNPATGWHIQNNTVNWYVLNILQQNVDSLTCMPQGSITTAVSGVVIGPGLKFVITGLGQQLLQFLEM
jgi:hypothetical protein